MHVFHPLKYICFDKHCMCLYIHTSQNGQKYEKNSNLTIEKWKIEYHRDNTLYLSDWKNYNTIITSGCC